MRKLRAGVVGLGVMGRHHLRVLGHLEGVELVGIFDPAFIGISDVSGIPVHASLKSLLSAGIDYCVLAAPTSLHHELGLQLAQSGIHTLIEKPVATTEQQAVDLARAFSQRDLIGGVGHIERFNPAIQSMRLKIAEGLLGDLYQIATRRQGPRPERVSDVGVIKDLATHDIDLTMWISQRTYTSVKGHTYRQRDGQYEDMLVVAGVLQDDVIVSHLVNWLSPYKERCTTVIGERGALVADTLTADLTYFENGNLPSSWDGVSWIRGGSEGNITRFALTKTEPLLVEHRAFRDAIVNKDESEIVTLQQGCSVVKVAEQIAESCYQRTR